MSVSYRIYDQPQVRELFLTATPSENLTCCNEYQGHGETVPDCAAQTELILQKVGEILDKEGFSDSAVMQNVFLADLGKKQLVRKIMADFYAKRSTDCFPATTFVEQPPCGGSEISLELFAVAPKTTFSRKNLSDQDVILEYEDLKFGFFGEILPDEQPIGAYPRSLSVFENLEKRLKKYDLNPEELFRVWLYQGLLVLPEGETQRYKELNRARTVFFENLRFLSRYLPENYAGPTVYPASTGIGTDNVDLVMSGIALSTSRKDVLAVPLENPNQVSAFDYNANYSPQSPKFARAMGLKIGDCVKVYVSGTAGITDSESRYENDPIGQTELTLDNIATLISGKNLQEHGIPGRECELTDLAVARVYVKRIADYQCIRAVCEKRCPQTPILYTIADVCRPELLVEIEGIAFAAAFNLS